MIERVLNLNQRSVSSIMTSRHDIERINLSAPEEEIRSPVEKNQHTRLVVTGGKDNEDLLGWCMLLTCSSSPCVRSRWICRRWCVNRWSSRRACRSSRRSSSSAGPAPILPLWWMSLVPSRDCDPQRRDGDHRR